VRFLVVAGACAAVAGCFVPPSRSSFGGAATGKGAGYRVSVGAHSEAADTADTAPVDLGAGWVSEGADDRDAAHGTYVSLGRRVPLGARDALWISGRVEMYWLVDPGQPRDGVSARLSYRHRVGGVRWGTGDGEGGLGVLGVLATGLYCDVGAREFAGGGSEVFVSAGIELDLPLLVAVTKLTPFAL
jgi:hypothetical protein